MKKVYIKRYQSNFKLRYLIHLAATMLKYHESIIYTGSPTVEEQKLLTTLETVGHDILWGMNYDFHYIQAKMKLLYMGK